MTSIRTDLSSLTRDGLLQAYRDRVRGGVATVGTRVIVSDITGDDEAYAAMVRAIEDDVLLLEVDWDNEHALEIEPEHTGGLAVGLIEFGSFDHVRVQEPEQATKAIRVLEPA